MIAILRLISVLVVAAMLGSSLVTYSILRRADTIGELVLQSHRTLEAAEETLRRSVDAESGAVGFVSVCANGAWHGVKISTMERRSS